MELKFFILPVLAFFLGVGLRTIYNFPKEGVLLCLMVSFVLGLSWRRRSFASSAPTLLLLSLVFLFLALGIFRTELELSRFGNSDLEKLVGREVELVGRVVQEPEERLKSKHLYIKSGEDKILVFADRLTEVSYGDVVIVSGELSKPQSFVTDLGREFDYPKYLLVRGVEYQISFAEVSISGTVEGNYFVSTLLAAKHMFMSALEEIIPVPAVGLGEGLLLGVKSALGADIEDNFRRTGIIHIVVLSGYNIMLVVTFVMSLLSYIFKPKPRFFIGLLSIVSFALIVGLSATVVRASIMAALLITAQTWGRKYDVLRALFLAGLVMILINPLLLVYDIGFQLSFMATLGLILVVPHFENRLSSNKNFFGWRDFFIATLATQIAVLPLLIYHIGEVSLVAVLVNLLVLPVVPIAMLLTFIAGVFAFASVKLALVVGYLANLVLNYILFVADVFGRLSFASIVTPEIGPPFLFFMYGSISFIYFYLFSLKPEAESIKGWVIEEEEKAGSQSEPAQTKDLPIFFR